MARKNTKAQQDQAATQPEVAPEASEQEANAPEAEAEVAAQEKEQDQAATKPKGTGKAGAKTKVRMVDAKLKTRHCRGGRCKEAGETMRMTQGEYDRLKKYDRVE